MMGVSYIGITGYFANKHNQETTQRLNAEVANHVIAEKFQNASPFLEDGSVNKPLFGDLMHDMMAVNRGIEVYLLNEGGEILYSVVLDPNDKDATKSVSLTPIKSFIADQGENFILGDDPRSPGEQKIFSATAIEHGATALILQPPADKLEDDHLSQFFSEVISSVDCPPGIQNAPDFIGFGLSNASLIALANSHDNFTIAKLECSAVALEPVATELKDKVMVFNGRCGLELTDNLRAGATGMIPALETVDKTTDIFSAFLSGDEEHADKLYKEVLPVISFIMQGIPHFLTYGKLLAAIRLGIEFRGYRNPLHKPTSFGIACTERFAASLGELKT